MKIEYRKKFLKELSKVPAERRFKIESFVFKELPRANSKIISLSTNGPYLNSKNTVFLRKMLKP